VYAFAVLSKYLAMLVSILDRKTPSDRTRFERAHNMTVAIGFAYENEIHLGRHCEFMQILWWKMAHPEPLQVGKAIPVPTHEVNIAPSPQKLSKKVCPIRIRAANK
jgi:hypothetical protein